MSKDRRPTPDARRPEDRFDVAVDRAVREMLDVEQPAGLRGRVLRQIENPLSTRQLAAAFTLDRVASAFRRKIWITAPLAVAAVLILAVLAPWRAQAPTPVVSGPSQMVAVPPLPSAPPPAPQPRPTGSAPIAPRTPSGSVPALATRVVNPEPDRVVAAADYSPAERVGDEIEPLRAMTPIQMTAIPDQRFSPAEIALRPLNTITDVQIAPLTPPDRRN